MKQVIYLDMQTIIGTRKVVYTQKKHFGMELQVIKQFEELGGKKAPTYLSAVLSAPVRLPTRTV